MARLAKLQTLCLLAALVGCASKPSVDPSVKRVFTSSVMNEEGDIKRAIVRNTEIQPCLEIDTVNLRGDKAKVLDSKLLCDIEIEAKTVSVRPSDIQEIDYKQLVWQKGILTVELGLTKSAAGSLYQDYRCKYDGKSDQLQMACTLAKK
ncbi:MAG: hypothetical protein HRT45_18815 [Bdellovibrionales bacterium]|nr:hypothetical protein [Bdellovibrionales bacterium]